MNDKTVEESSTEEPEPSSNIIVMNARNEELDRPRIVGLYGEVEEQRCAELIYTMLLLKDSGKETDEEGEVISYHPFELYVSTHGGSAVDMFSVYDIMRMIQNDCEIHTIGIGKVMSAGVLILAAGTKGKRKIGANCRAMIHSISSNHSGSIHDLRTELEDVKWIQDQTIKALVKETTMAEEFIRELMSRNTNVYLTAEEAIEYGIADEIV